jgi:hypothetical protein
MIGDVLFDAVEEIKRYQELCDYGELEHEIRQVVTLMDAFRLYTDCSPGCRLDSHVAELRQAIIGLDVSQITAAKERWLAEVRRLREGSDRANGRPAR